VRQHVLRPLACFATACIRLHPLALRLAPLPITALQTPADNPFWIAPHPLVVNGLIKIPRNRLRPWPTAPPVVRRRYFIVLPRLLPAAPLVVHRRYFIVPKAVRCLVYLIVAPRLMPAAPRWYLIVVHRP
jgi:hypothetical protein